MAFNESALEQPYMSWDDVVSSEAYRSRNNEERIKTFDTWSEYNVAYRQKQMGGMNPDAIQKAEPNLKEEEEWMTSKREQLSGKYSIPGLLEREEVPAEDSGRVIDILQDTESLKQKGFSDSQINEARDKVWDAYGESFKFSQTGPTGQLSESDEELKKRFWEDPTAGDNLNTVWNQFANNTYTVALRTLAGIADLSDRGSAMLANAGSMLGLPEDEKYTNFEENKDERFFGGIANWARQTSGDISAGLPTDPRLGRYTQAAIGGATQMPINLITAPFTAINAVTNYGQMYEDNYQTFKDAHARAIYDEAVSAGRVAPETSFDIWESRLTDEERADINGAAAWKAAVVAVPQAALETVMDKFLVNGIPLEGVPGGKVVGSLMSWGRRSMPKMSAAAAVFGSATAKGLGESVTEGLQDFPKNVVETAIEGKATGVSDFLARSFKDLDLSMVGGFAGGTTAGVITANTTLRQERAAQWAIGMVDQNSELYKQAAARVENTKQQAGEQSLQYKEASRNFEALQDQAHWVLNKLGDPKAEANRAAVAEERAKATKAFRDEFSSWAKQNGFENALAAGENNRKEFSRKVGEIRGRFANLRRAAQTQGLTQTAQAIDEAERTQIAEAAKQLGESQKEAQDAVNAFIGSVDQSGPGRAAYARAEVMRVFPNFAFSEDFKNDDVVIGILDALESREINADTDLAAWLQKEIPSTKVEETVVNPTAPTTTESTQPVPTATQTQTQTTPQNDGQTNTENQASGENAAVSEATTDESGTGVGSETGGTGTVSVAETATKTGTTETSGTTPSPIVPAVTQSADSELDAAVAEANTAEEFEAWAKKNKRDTIRPPEGGIYAPRAYWSVRKQQQQTEGATPNVETDQTTVEAGATGETAPESALDETQLETPPTADTAAIVAEVEANPQAHSRKTGRRTEISREAAVAALTKLPEGPISRRQAIELGKELDLSGPRVAKLAALRGDTASVSDILAGKYDAELGLFDRATATEAPTPATETKPETAKTETDAASEIAERTPADRWVAVATSAFEKKLNELTGRKFDKIKAALKTEEGRAEIQRKLAGIFSKSLEKNLLDGGVIDPVERAEAIESALYGKTSETTGELTKNVLADLITNLEKTGDPFQVLKGVNYDAWGARGRDQARPGLTRQSKRGNLVTQDGRTQEVADDAQGGRTLSSGTVLGGATSTEQLEREARLAEYESRKSEAIQETALSVAEKYAAQLGETVEDTRLAIAKLLKDDFGIDVDVEGLGWRTPGSKSRVKTKLVAKLKSQGDAIFKDLATSLRSNLAEVTAAARADGLLQSEAARVSSLRLIDLVEREIVIGLETVETLKDAADKARSAGSIAPLEAALRYIKSNEAIGFAISDAVAATLNNGNPLTNPERLSSLTNEDLKAVAESPLLPEGVGAVLSALTEIGGDPLDIVSKSSKPEFRLLASILKEARKNTPRETLVYNFALLPQLFGDRQTAQGYWWSNNKGSIYVSPFSESVEGTALHEYLHALVNDKLDIFLNDPESELISDAEREAFNEIIELKAQVETEALQRIADAEARGISKDALRQMRRDLLGGVNNTSIDLSEFLNESLNHKPFQQFLSELKSDKAGKSLYAKVLNAVLRFVVGRKVAADSALQRAFELTVSIATDTRQNIPIQERNPTQVQFMRRLQARLGRPLTPDEIEIAARDFAIKYPHPASVETEAAAAEATSQLTGAGVDSFNALAFEFVSPNDREDLTFEQALAALNAEQQGLLKDFGNRAAEALGITGSNVTDAIGDWADGAEPTTLTEHQGDIPYEDLRILAALKGAFANQKAVIPFKVDPTGEQFLYELVIPGVSLGEARDILSTAGLQYRTLIEQEGGTRVIIFDADGSAFDSFADLVQSNNYEFNFFNGRGEFLGTGESRTESKEIYAGAIAAEIDRLGREGQNAGPESAQSVRANRLRELAREAGLGDQPALQASAQGVGPDGGSNQVQRQNVRPNAEPNPFVQESVDGYNRKFGLGRVVQGHYAPVNEQRARNIAAAYDALPVLDSGPETLEAYSQLALEIQRQWDYALNEMGVTFEPWTSEGQPYASSREMVRDVRDNKHLWFFTGGEPHPLLNQPDENGLTMNDKLRAIHDLFGHAAEDYQFGPRGEENAWIKHSQMFSPLAQRALTTETRGQNSWVNYGPQNFAADGTRINIPASERPFAVQKVALLPEQFMDWQGALNETPAPSASQPAAAPTPSRLSPAERDQAVTFLSQTDLQTSNALDILSQMAQPDWMSITERLPTTALMRLAQAVDGVSRPFYEGIRLETMSIVRRGINRTVAQRTAPKASFATATQPDEELFGSMMEAREYVRRRFLQAAKALKTDIYPNLGGYTAHYIVSGAKGEHFIEYNPYDFVGLSRAQVDATMREELIHAASGLVLRQKGVDWEDFYRDLAKSLTKKQRAQLKQVYTSADTLVDVGAEYFRAGVQKLLYGTITEQELGDTPMQKIVTLLKDVVAYFRKSNMSPAVREIYEETVKMVRRADPKFAAGGPSGSAAAQTSAPDLSMQVATTYLDGYQRLLKGLRDSEIRSFKEKSKFLTEPERAKFREDTRRTFLDIYKSLPSEKEFAAAALGGQAKRGWYENSTKALIQVFGTDAPRFAALLAATSPQTSVENNLINALNTWKNWTAQGRPTDRASIVRIMGESVMGNKGEDSVLDAWINNSVRALASEFPEELTISGPKVNSFMLNLRGFVNEVTNDAWMANFALVDQVIFSGSLNADGTDPGKRPGYLAMSARVRAAADYLTKLTGETWTPAEVQETVWSWAKTLYELQERKGETRDALEILQAGELTDEAIAATPDFATLLDDGNYRQILEEAGYGESLAGLAGLRSGPDGRTERAFTPEAGSPAAKAVRAGQERAAARLAKLYQLRAQESERNRVPAPKASAPSFASAPVPGFVPSTFGPDARTTSEALYRIRFMSPDYAPIGRALADKTHFKWTETGTLDKALEFIDVAHQGDLKAAFYASESGGGLTPEQAVIVQGFVLKRTQEAANVARAEIAALVNAASISNDASEKSKILRRVRDLELVRDLYQQDADAFADRVADAASQAGSELRAFRLLADTLVPRSWVRQYTRPISKVQANKVKSDKTGRDIMASLISARRAAANKAAKRIDSLLKQAAKGFLPKKLTQEEIEAATQVARMLAAPIPVRDQIINAAVEDAVIQGLETIKRGVNPQQENLQSILNVWEKRLRDTATDQLNKAIQDRLSGGMVASPQPTLTEDEKREAEARKLADFWREFSDLPFAETVFNVAQAKISSADTPYANLVKGVQFDPAASNILKRTVRGSINISEEIRKTADERGLTVDVLKARLAQHNPSLTDTQLVRLAEAVEKVYNAEVQEAARAALERIKKTAATPQEREIVDNKVIQRLLPLVNMGVFSDEAAYNAVAEKYNLPTYDEATVKRLETMATELQALPEGSFQRLEGGQHLALEILRAHFSSAKGKQKFRHLNNIASAFWTAAILSAPPTQIVNASMTSVSVFLESMAEATGYYIAGRRAGMSRRDARQFFSDASRAWLFAFGKNASNTSRRAIDEAYMALKKGTTRFKSEKMEDLAPLEMFDFDPRVSIPGNAMMEALASGEFKNAAQAAKDTAKGVGKTMGSRAKGMALGLVSGDVNRAGRSTVDALKDYAATMKLVGRMMLAADAVNSTAASSAKEMMMRRYLAATQEGMSSTEVEALMTEIRNGGNQNVKDMATATAEDEAQRGDFGPKGTREHEIAKARRIEQIIEQQTYGPEIMAKGRDFAAIASFNSEPYGVVGWFMTFLFGNMNKVGGVVLKPINPFPKTVSNLLNAALNYTPYGNLRAQGWNLANQVVFDEDSKFFRAAPEMHSPEWYAAHARGLAGTAALVLLGMMIKGAADERDEGRVPWFEIFGAGPKTARERRQWREAGGVQFSIKMGNLVLRYTDWPGLSIALGVLGTLYDNHVWGSKEQTFVDKLFVGMTSVVGTTLNRNMLGGASVVFDMVSSSTSDDQKQAAWARYLASYPQGFIRPAMVRWAETIATGTYQENRSLPGWIISQMPVVGAFRGRPSLNVLGEPIQVSAWDATAGRLVSLKDTHLILSPLTDANLFINPAQSYKLVDPSTTVGLRDMTQSELYDYSKLYGEELRKVLTPALVDNLVKISRQNPEAAQDNLNEIALAARNRAQGLLRAQRNFQKAPRR